MTEKLFALVDDVDASAAIAAQQGAEAAATLTLGYKNDAETALDTFTDIFLGALASDPATDNDGDPLQAGALYFNTTSGLLRVYNGALSAWQTAVGTPGLAQVEDDPTPALGGDLDLNTHDITGTGNIDITGNVTATGYGAFLGGGMGTQFSDPGVYLGIETNGNAQFNIVSTGTYGYFDIGGVNEDYKFRFLTTIATGNTDLQTSGVVSINGNAIWDAGDFNIADYLTSSTAASTYQPLDADLSALAALSSTGLLARTGSNTYAERTLTAPAAGITVTNGTGVSGNPTLALADDLAALEALSGTNTIYYRSGASTWTAVSIGTALGFSGGTLAVTDAELTALAGLTSAADRLPYFTGAGTASLATFTSAARNLLDDSDAATMRTTLGVAIGSNVQAWDADLDALAALAGTNTIYYRSAANTWSAVTVSTGLTFTGGTLSVTSSTYQPLDALLTSIAGLTFGADTFIYGTGSDTAAAGTITSVGRTLVSQSTQALARTTGLGMSSNGSSLVAAADYAAMRTLLDLEPGTDFYSVSGANAAFQPLDSDLTAIAGISTTAAGRSILSIADPNADRIIAWDDSAGALAPIALSDITTESVPASGDYFLMYGAEGDLRKVNFDDMPGGSGAGANVALSNLSTVAINTSLVSDTDSTDDLGSSSIAWRKLYVDEIELGHASGNTLTASSGTLSIEGTALLKSSDIGSTVQAFGALTGANVQVFTSNDTYTPTSGTKSALVFVTGGGGGGGGSDCSSSTNSLSLGGGGGAGGTCLAFYNATEIGANAAVAVGSGGNGGSATAGTGSTGGTSTFTPAGTGATATATGGTGGDGAVAGSNSVAYGSDLAPGGTASNGLINISGGQGFYGGAGEANYWTGDGGSSFWGSGAPGRQTSNGTGTAAGPYGAGGGGAATESTTSGSVGGAGAGGVVMILEFF